MSDIIDITDFLSPELDVYARLSEVRLLNHEFPEKGMFIAESPKLIMKYGFCRSFLLDFWDLMCYNEKKLKTPRFLWINTSC